MVGIAVNVRTTVINRDFAEVKLRNFWKITTSYHDSDIFIVIPNMLVNAVDMVGIAVNIIIPMLSIANHIKQWFVQICYT
jgi:hypothetical protein